MKTFFENGVHRNYDIMSLSGTSGCGRLGAGLDGHDKLFLDKEMKDRGIPILELD